MEPAAHIRPGFVVLALRRRWRMLVVGALLGLVVGVGAGVSLPVSYTSTASLFLNPVAGNPYQPEIGTARSDQLVALETEVSLVGTPEVGALAAALSAVALPDDPERNVNVSSPSNSQIIRVTYTAGRGEVATAGAQAFAEAYLDYRRQRAEAANLAQAEQLQQQIDATNTVSESTAADLSTASPGSSRALFLQQQLTVYSSQLAQLNLQLTEARSAVGSTGEIISPATAATQPSGLPVWMVAAAGLAGGLGIALLVALAREHGDTRVHDAQELSGLGVGHPLATVPLGAAAVELRSVSPDGYRLLHTVVTSRDDRRTPVVCLLGTHGSTAAADVAAGLAAAGHRLGRRVLLVGSGVPTQWEPAREVDLDDVVAADGPAPVTPTILTLGPDAASTEEAAMSAAMVDTLVRARHAYDLVVLAGGDGGSALGWRFAALADVALVVGELGRDGFDELLDLVETLRQSGVDEVAVVAAATPKGTTPVRWRGPGDGGRSSRRRQVDRRRRAERGRGAAPAPATDPAGDLDGSSGLTRRVAGATGSAPYPVVGPLDRLGPRRVAR